MDLSDLTADCTRCSGLCCMAYHLVEGPDFAFDKPAGKACRHLGTDNLCTIHAALRDNGFGGCVVYDCLGAGQRVCNDILPGLDWRRSEADKTRMIAALKAMRAVHDLLQMVLMTDRFPLSLAQAAERQNLIDRLDPTGGWDETALAAFGASTLDSDTRAFLRSLSPLVPDRHLA